MTKAKPSWMTEKAVKWHKENKMPKNPSVEQRIKWHSEHAKNCTCRPMPDSVKALIH